MLPAHNHCRQSMCTHAFALFSLGRAAVLTARGVRPHTATLQGEPTAACSIPVSSWLDPVPHHLTAELCCSCCHTFRGPAPARQVSAEHQARARECAVSTGIHGSRPWLTVRSTHNSHLTSLDYFSPVFTCLFLISPEICHPEVRATGCAGGSSSVLVQGA